MHKKPISIQVRPGLDAPTVKDVMHQTAGQLSLQAEEKEIQFGLKFTFSDGREVLPLAVYFRRGHATRMVLERPQLALSQRVTAILRSSLLVTEGERLDGGLNRFARYAVISPDLGENIRQDLTQIGEVTEITVGADHYDVSVSSGGASVRVRRFPNGTLLAQGAGTALWDSVCTAIEAVVGPAVSEVASRFVSASEEETSRVARLLTPQLQEDAEREVRAVLGPAFDFMSSWDKKYLLSSLILLRAQVEVPEYSCMVMPASKAFEGYVREVFLNLGIIEKADTVRKGWGVREVFKKESKTGAYLNPRLHDYAVQGKHRKTYIERINNEVDRYRNFMMHSDESAVTKVESHSQAVEVVTEILKAIRDSFDFFVKGIQ